MKTLRVVVAVVLMTSALRASAVPFHGCTFYQPRLAAASESCADFTINWNACTITHCAWIFCVSYPGEWVTGYMPDHFIEVTNRAAKSAFSTVDAPLMVGQMELADTNWSSFGDFTGVRTTQQRPKVRSEFGFWFGHTLPVPYGNEGWTFASLGWTAGTPVPTCFSGVTEFAAETWSDNADSGDRLLAGLWSPLTAPACIVAAPVMGLMQDLPIPDVDIPMVQPCAFPLAGGVLQEAMALTGLAALDPLKQCMGTLGPMLPRTGWTDGDPWIAAQRVAWRSASMAEDYWKTGVGVYPGEKWQVIWPPMAVPRCFAPGSLLRPTTAEPTSTLVRSPVYDAGTGGTSPTEFVYAVWRRRQACVEPASAPAVDLEMSTYWPVHTALCDVMNAVVDAL